MSKPVSYPLSHASTRVLAITPTQIFIEYTLNKYVDFKKLRPWAWQKDRKKTPVQTRLLTKLPVTHTQILQMGWETSRREKEASSAEGH